MRGATVRDAGATSKNPDAESSASIRRAATSVIARSVAQNNRKNRTVVNARPAVSRAATKRTVGGRTSAISNSSNVSRVATTNRAAMARSGVNGTNIVRSAANVSRAGTARATAVFNDVSKIGGGYAACRDSYATCMDQFCANANDTYRRCYCSNRFIDFRKTSDSLDQALTMLADFQNTNLDAVDKTAAEVDAMYSASEGEAAIKRDTSASQKLLDNISDLLSGKKSSSYTTSSGTSTGVLDFSGLLSSSGGDDDIWGGSSSLSSAFDFGGSSRYTNMSDMEGDELYTAANRQCSSIARNECGGDAVFNLARSAYSIMITQDCNIYEKNINAKRESVQNTVRTAEKYLREARLEEYRAHNSPDVNACLDNVESAIRRSTACGENYEKCLDYTGLYINNVTGEPVYSKALFDLNNLIVLDGSADVLSKNAKFDTFLEEKKIFAESALDSCRGIADTVWYEFKRSALIQIAQAQDAKIQEVKDTCVQTVKDCYDQQISALDELGGDDITKLTSAISAIAAHDMCRDSVLTCASLYGDVDGCVYDDSTKTLRQREGKKCGLQSLLAYVNTVDSVRVAQGCENSLREYAKELCSNEGDSEYPWGCRLRSESDIRAALTTQARNFCGADLITTTTGGGSGGSGSTTITVPKEIATTSVTTTTATTTSDRAAKHNNIIVSRAAKSGDGLTEINQDLNKRITNTTNIIKTIVADIKKDLAAQLAEECNNISGEGQLFWASSDATIDSDEILRVSPTWLKTVFGTDSDLAYLKQYGIGGYTVRNENTNLELKIGGSRTIGWGVCMKPTQRQICAMQQALPKMEEKYIQYNPKNKTCEIKDEQWYKIRCQQIDGYWSGQRCYVR